MLGSYWGDFERTFAAMDDLRRRFERTLDRGPGEGPGRWPRMSLHEVDGAFVLRADVPGFVDKDINVQLENDVLTVSGERKAVAPEGYAVHRQERSALKFSRSFAIGARLNADGIEASLRDGVLTVRLPKAPEDQPRRIAVKAA